MNLGDINALLTISCCQMKHFGYVIVYWLRNKRQWAAKWRSAWPQPWISLSFSLNCSHWMEWNVLKERLMNKDNKNRHFVLLIIDISKHGANGSCQNGRTRFREWCYSMMTRFCSKKKLRTNRNQSLYFLWNNIEIMAFVTVMSTRWIQFKVT